MAQPETADEVLILKAIRAPSPAALWLPMTYSVQDESWMWHDGTPVGWENWDEGQPSYSTESSKTTQKLWDTFCAQMKYGSGEWSTLPCEWGISWICVRPQVVCPNNWIYHPDTDRCYIFQDRKVSQSVASSSCQDLGGHLPMPKNEAEGLFVSTLSQEVVWLGVSDEKMEGEWVWADGGRVEWTNWWPGGPNGGEPDGGDSQNCAFMYGGASSLAGQWRDYFCSSTCRFICTKQAEQLSTGVLLPRVSVSPPIDCQDLPEWKHIPALGQCFRHFDVTVTQPNAIIACEQLEAQLPMPRSQLQLDYLLTVSSHSWLGLTKTETGQWMWGDGDIVQWANWATLSPHNTYDDINATDSCSYMYSNRGLWDDLSCQGMLPYACVKKSSANVVVPSTPVLTSQPSANGGVDSLAVGTTVNLTCQSTADGTVTFQFIKDSKFVLQSGQESSYILQNSNIRDTGEYSCSVTLDGVWYETSKSLIINITGCEMDWTYHPLTDQCYRFFRSSQNQLVASQTCHGLGGRLASARNENETDLLSQVHNSEGYYNTIWLGLKYSSSSESWTWADGAPVCWSSWIQGFPKGDGDCAVSFNVWRDYDCSSRRYFVCTIPGSLRQTDQTILNGCTSPNRPTTPILSSNHSGSVRNGKTVALSCPPRGTVGSLTFYFLMNNVTTHTVFSPKLILVNVSTEDTGNYTCRISKHGILSHPSNVIELKVVDTSGSSHFDDKGDSTDFSFSLKSNVVTMTTPLTNGEAENMKTPSTIGNVTTNIEHTNKDTEKTIIYEDNEESFPVYIIIVIVSLVVVCVATAVAAYYFRHKLCLEEKSDNINEIEMEDMQSSSNLDNTKAYTEYVNSQQPNLHNTSNSEAVLQLDTNDIEVTQFDTNDNCSIEDINVGIQGSNEKETDNVNLQTSSTSDCEKCTSQEATASKQMLTPHHTEQRNNTNFSQNRVTSKELCNTAETQIHNSNNSNLELNKRTNNAVIQQPHINDISNLVANVLSSDVANLPDGTHGLQVQGLNGQAVAPCININIKLDVNNQVSNNTNIQHVGVMGTGQATVHAYGPSPGAPEDSDDDDDDDEDGEDDD